MVITDELLKKVQQKEYEMLVLFDKICRKHNLKYSLFFGTLLGAVRHKGFIPWDDDIDVVMPRFDYEIFVKVANKELPENFFFEHPSTEKNFVSPYGRIRNNLTTWFEKAYKYHKEINQGIFIDVFVCDLIDDEKTFEKIRKKSLFYDRLQRYRFFRGRNDGLLRKIVGTIFFTPIAKIMGNKKIALKWDKAVQSGNKTAHPKYVFLGDNRDKTLLPAYLFDEYTELPFEGKTFMCIKKYDEFLSLYYGDYMTPPKEEDRFIHHPVSIIDPDKPFTFYQK